MDAEKEFFACLALRHTPGIGPKTCKALLAHYPSVFAAISEAKSWPGLKLANRRQAESVARQSWRKAAEREYRLAKALGLKALTWSDPQFPQRLKEIPDPPLILYWSGDLSLLLSPGVAVVGARACTGLGLSIVERISRELSRCGITIISGLAPGIDRQAHLAGLSGVGGTIAVLGAGIDVDYPAQNRDLREAIEQKGLVLTEFAPAVRPEAKNFPIRNRLISGLSFGVLVAQAAQRSGSLITARLAAEQGREVFALPGPAGEPSFAGCHRLIKEGATLVESAEDIIRALRFQFGLAIAIPERQPEPETPAAQGPGAALAAQEEAKPARRSRPARGEVAQSQVPEPAAKPLPEPRCATAAHTAPDDFSLTEEERALLERLASGERLHVDELSRQLAWDAGRTGRVLVVLEMRGVVRRLPGMWYSLA